MITSLQLRKRSNGLKLLPAYQRLYRQTLPQLVSLPSGFEILLV